MAAESIHTGRSTTTLLQILTGLPRQPARLLRAAINAGRTLYSEKPAASSSLADPTLAARGWHSARVALAGWGCVAADWTLAHEGKTGWGAARLNTLCTVDVRDVALGDGTTLAGNAQLARRVRHSCAVTTASLHG